MSDGGKGSKPRTMEVSREEFSSNWDAIFKKKQVESDDDDIVNEQFLARFEKSLELGRTYPNNAFTSLSYDESTNGMFLADLNSKEVLVQFNND